MNDKFEELKTERLIAMQNLNYAELKYIDAAIYHLKAVDEKLKELIKEMRETGDKKTT